ncbi:tRNA 2'-phosphotransferase [Coemansia sp. RSA 2611]|nr:tRNA 2'-phosphotransferase [Coemansia sp. RSA 2611]
MSHAPAKNSGRRRQPDSPDIRLSKLLSYLLRHGAVQEGLRLRADGSIALNELQKHHKLQSVSFDRIKHIVETNEKQRFVLFAEPAADSEPVWYIRASQGHSLKVEALPLTRLTADNMPACVVHGTTRNKLPAIRRSGLSKMSRNHIHMASGLASDAKVVSGMRASSDTLIYIDTAKALDAGIEFYRSDNGVILSEGLNKSGVIPPEFFEKIVFRD